MKSLREVIKFRFTYRIGAGLAEEDVECRPLYSVLLNRIEFVLKRLIDSWWKRNQSGIPVAIGEPNVGKESDAY
jgi:hypothetical protein